VTRNYAEKSINNILDYVGGEGKVSIRLYSLERTDSILYSQHANLSPQVPLDTLEEFYEATRIACEEAKNEVCPVNERHSDFAYDLRIALVDEVQPQTREAMVG